MAEPFNFQMLDWDGKRSPGKKTDGMIRVKSRIKLTS